MYQPMTSVPPAQDAMDEPQASPVRPRYTVIVNEAPKFDIPSYISNYGGRTVFRRLYLIASCCPPLREEASRLAFLNAEQGNDVQNYEDALALIKASSRSVLDRVDPAWLDKKAKQNKAETARLEHELKGYKNNLIRESIRMGNEDLGLHYHHIGDLASATKAFSRMRDQCTTPSQIASTAFRIVAVAIEQSNWLAVQSQVQKIRNLSTKSEETDRNQPKIQAAMGLYQMCTGDYHNAAVSFVATDPSLGDRYKEIISSNDIATYGGLCALASMSRSELQSKVLDNNLFRGFLELEPHLRRAVNFFCASKYSQCLEILESYRADYLLDIYLQPHVEDIFQKIRTKSIVQFFQPFSRITLDKMEEIFGPSPAAARSSSASGGAINGAGSALSQPSIEQELISLIESGTLPAKIDLENRVLVSNSSDLRADVHAQTSAMVNSFLRETRIKILRLNAQSAGLDVKAPPGSKGKAPASSEAAPDTWMVDAVQQQHHQHHQQQMTMPTTQQPSSGMGAAFEEYTARVATGRGGGGRGGFDEL